MNSSTLIPILLLALLLVALASGIAVVLLVFLWQRRENRILKPPMDSDLGFSFPALPNLAIWHRPSTWLAVRSRNLQAVQAAFGLINPKPCSWAQGFTADPKLFIAPPVKGWILITGSRLPEPSEDVDACFRFLVNLSRNLGRVQYFSANAALGHHAWVRAEAGRVVRAYAWAGKTLWNQGAKSSAERGLGLKCFHYSEEPKDSEPDPSDLIALNVERVPLLAACWSIDPAAIDERTFHHACGIAGEPARLY
jgi:hypothetical protein